MSNNYYVLSLVPSILCILFDWRHSYYVESTEEQSLGFSKIDFLKTWALHFISNMRRRCVLILSKSSTSRSISVPPPNSITPKPCFPGANTPGSSASLLPLAPFSAFKVAQVCLTCVEKSQVWALSWITFCHCFLLPIILHIPRWAFLILCFFLCEFYVSETSLYHFWPTLGWSWFPSHQNPLLTTYSY